ncbi:MAG: hypothetical protein AAB792_02050 [Patescibacteria group bacterium]
MFGSAIKIIVSRNKKMVVPILILIVVSGIFVPQHYARAVSSCAPLPGVFDLTNCAIEIFNIPLYIIAWLLGFVAGLLNDFITATGTIIIPAVRESWTILRDFVNMLFILVLIIMAFGTIFDIKKYTWREMLVPFLIAALLINFSFVIGEYTISIGNGLSSVFLKQIGATNLKDRIGQGLGMQKIIANPEGKSLEGTTFSAIGGAASALQQLITIIFFIIFGTIALMAMIAAFIFVFLRIPILWMLLIVSPIAWFGYTLPNLKAQTWDRWWHEFIRWVFFLPVYLFFLMFGFIFIAAKNSTQQLVASATLGQSALIVVNDIAFYVITLIFLAGGLWASFKVGGVAGSDAAKLMGGIEKRVKQYMPGAGYVRAIGAGAKAGLQAKGEQIQEKGIPGIFAGAQAERLRQAKWTERFGFGAARGAADRARTEETEKEFKKVQTLNLTQQQLNERVQGAKGVEKVAAFKVKAENGWLAPTDLDEINRTMRELGGGRSAAGTSLLGSLRKGKFHEMAVSTAEKERIFGSLTDPETQKAFGLDMAESRELMSAELAEKLLGIYEGDTAEVKKKVEDAVKNNIENIARDQAARRELLTGTGDYAGADDRVRKLAGQVMADKKEIDSWKLRGEALGLNGGMDPETGEALTAEGRELAKNIEDGNIAIKEEKVYRKANPGILHTADLNQSQHDEVKEQIITNIAKKLITGFTTEELQTPEVFNALLEGVRTGRIPVMQFDKLAGLSTGKGGGKPDRKKREAGAKIAEAAFQGGSPLSYS